MVSTKHPNLKETSLLMQFVSDVTVQLLVERPQFLPRVFHLADKVVGAVVGHQHVCSVDEAEHSVGGTKQ